MTYGSQQKREKEDSRMATRLIAWVAKQMVVPSTEIEHLREGSLGGENRINSGC